MNSPVSTNTQAILLLTAPLIAGRNGTATEELLTPGEYRRLARQLRDLGRAPSDLLGTDCEQLLKELNDIVPAGKVGRLLERGFMFSQAIERWQSRAIWVISRADSNYPRQLKNRLKEDSPAVLYGCGEPRLLDSGGLAVIGSRHVDDALIEYTEGIGRRCAAARKNIISGGAQGIDRAAMRGALEAGGRVVGILADSLERAALNRDNRDWLVDEKLILVSPYDPSAGFNVGHAMQRNKIIYALADAALVVSAEYKKGGTWSGATEQLEKLKYVPVYVRSTGELGQGLDALTRLGAKPWPNPEDSGQLSALLNAASKVPVDQQPTFEFRLTSLAAESHSASQSPPDTSHRPEESDSNLAAISETKEGSATTEVAPQLKVDSDPAAALMTCVRELLVRLLTSPKSEVEVASSLQVSNAQARAWLKKLVKDGFLRKVSKPVRYVIQEQKLL